MKHYAGLDVSVKETSICIVDEAGRICREMKVISHPEDLLAVLCDPAWRLERVGLEAGPLSQWLFSGLAEAGVPAGANKLNAELVEFTTFLDSLRPPPPGIRRL